MKNKSLRNNVEVWDWRSGSWPLPPPPLHTQGWVQPWWGTRTLFCIPPVPQLRAAAVRFDLQERETGCGWLCWWHRCDTLQWQPAIHLPAKSKGSCLQYFPNIRCTYRVVHYFFLMLSPPANFWVSVAYCGLLSSETRGQIDSLAKFRSKCLNFVTFFVLWIGKELFS